jgi:membrane protein DedA with SNARE-associated domain
MELGYLSIVLLMVLSPFPPEVFMPLAGFMVSQNKLIFGYVILAGVIGFLISLLPWYVAGRYLGEVGFKKLVNRYPRWLSSSAKNIEKAQRRFHPYRKQAVFFSFLVPGVRNLVAASAGMSQTSTSAFLFYSTLGATLCTGVLTVGGYLLGSQYYLVDQYLGSIVNVIVMVLVVVLVILGMRRYLRSRKGSARANLTSSKR